MYFSKAERLMSVLEIRWHCYPSQIPFLFKIPELENKSIAYYHKIRSEFGRALYCRKLNVGFRCFQYPHESDHFECKL